MADKKIYDTVIIGAGPAGLSAAIYAGRATMDTLVIEANQVGGQVTTTSVVWNYPAVEKIDGTALMNQMQQQAANFGVQIVHDQITDYELEGDLKVLHGRQDYYARSVIIAAGAKPRELNFPGEQQFRGHGIAFCSTCDGELFTGLQVFVIGGGYAAAEEADYLTRYAKHVTVISREAEFTCAPLTAARALNNPKVDVKFNTEIVRVTGKDYLETAVFKNNQTGKEFSYQPDSSEQTFGVFIYIGTQPATAKLTKILNHDEHGYLKADATLATNLPGVFAAGDIVVKPLRQIVTAASDGAVAATSAEHYVTALKQRLQIPIERKQKSATKPVGQTTKLAEKSTVMVHQGSWFDAKLQQQLKSIFERLTQKVTLQVLSDNGQKSQELQSFVKEFCDLDRHLDYQVRAADGGEDFLPLLELLNQQQNLTGIRFAGIPTGHELNSLVLAVYNLAGPGQELAPELIERIKALPVTKIKIGVALTCHFCPDVVSTCQHMAAINPNVSAEMLDLQLFPELRQAKHIMSVPATMINDRPVIFGSQTAEQLVAACESATVK
ncbi:MAG: FAD-dependent oxidoreductase [Liquorilactobacillus nagelii]|uniref:Thioredoxin reductase n=1 Tax=Liquorilactobacillus nagelii TaxID=82688 RepID=A0A3S6QZA9_9LACO|nr:FAD-dependent oxidoreductase [Liquorilactobacillus nagelii]AUJ33109.1 thioredoxin reductase [Liquorilactobacillus nagelii]MCC7616525.1 thioredoxin reductase [Liquorilactobacillus nagelii]MCI1698982.1 FAD-dependent oxidoreductase [Liquorilactobacillus nagelii]MCP9315405.1 FAD-dependent oxidoreductase [Liquorilactobacillus nagelii]QYH54996.1 FAD-dependent oxidoreductase [Liquorilactobacillus nagelii DSM 13675]